MQLTSDAMGRIEKRTATTARLSNTTCPRYIPEVGVGPTDITKADTLERAIWMVDSRGIVATTERRSIPP